MSLDLILPDWPAPENVRAVTTTRKGGVSKGHFDSLNMGGHVGDDAASVATNRLRLIDAVSLPENPHWLSQVHGVNVVPLDSGSIGMPEGDAGMTQVPGCVCAVLTADCLPVLFCDRDGTKVAAAHAGWRGLVAGVLESTLNAMDVPGDDLLVWLGPAIGPQSFEVGKEVYQAFIDVHPEAIKAFEPSTLSSGGERWLADIYQLARIRLAAVGVTAVYGGEFCTYLDKERFFSFRRDAETGRMASLIWLESDSDDRTNQ